MAPAQFQARDDTRYMISEIVRLKLSQLESEDRDSLAKTYRIEEPCQRDSIFLAFRHSG